MSIAVKTNKKWFLIITLTLTTFLFIIQKSNNNNNHIENYPINYLYENLIVIKNEEINKRNYTNNWRGLTKTEIKNMSVLGRIMFLNEKLPKIHKTNRKTYEILVWKYGPTIERRHLKRFSTKFIDPFEDCSVNNCKITYEQTAIKSADLVLFHLHRMKNQTGELPTFDKNSQRDQKQIWAFLTDESPFNTFLYKNSLTNYNNVFNWSMTYRTNSDIPVPYGRTMLKKRKMENDVQIVKRRDILVVIMGSNCGGRNKRWEYVKELQKFIKVDIYGACGDLKTCPGHFSSDCHQIDSYMFYLAFENTNCDEYVTEKLWWNAYAKNSIPIVMGASTQTYKKLLPPNSYLNVEDFANPRALANYITYLNETGDYQKYYYWKRDFDIVNEHGYFQSRSYHYCRICEALNYNEKHVKIYKNLNDFWDRSKHCHPAWNQ